MSCDEIIAKFQILGENKNSSELFQVLGKDKEGIEQFRMLYTFMDNARETGNFDETKWQKIVATCFGLGLVLLNEARKRGWTDL